MGLRPKVIPSLLTLNLPDNPKFPPIIEKKKRGRPRIHPLPQSQSYNRRRNIENKKSKPITVQSVYQTGKIKRIIKIVYMSGY